MAESYPGLPGSSTTEYSVERSRSRVEGIMVCPIAGPSGSPACFIRVHAPIEMEAVYWSATAQGKAPVVPSPDSLTSDNNRVFLYGQQSAVIPVPTIGGHFFVLAGAYFYAIIQPETLTAQFNLGRMPWETTPPEIIPAQLFTPYGILLDKTSAQLPSGTVRPR